MKQLEKQYTETEGIFDDKTDGIIINFGGVESDRISNREHSGSSGGEELDDSMEGVATSVEGTCQVSSQCF